MCTHGVEEGSLVHRSGPGLMTWCMQGAGAQAWHSHTGVLREV